MQTETYVEAEKRTDLGKNAARRLRRSGRIPAVLYGGDGGVITLSLDPRSLEAILYSGTGGNTLFGLRINPDGAVPGRVMIKKHSVDPVTDKLTHADLMRIAMDKVIRVQVALHTVGVAKGVKLQAGILDHPMREVEVECLPADIPDRIDIDISELEIGHSLRVSDLKVPPTLKVLTDPHAALVSVVAPTIEKVEAPVAPVEGAAAAVPAEPEVIKKGKAETGEEGEAPGAEKKGADKAGDKGGGKGGGKAEKK